jgi:CheY-like chemotaxis protein
VFLDLGMPEPDGYQLAGQLQEQGSDPAPVVVAVTGFGDETHRQLACGLFDHYLVKAVEVEDLERILTGLAGRRWTGQAET